MHRRCAKRLRCDASSRAGPIHAVGQPPAASGRFGEHLLANCLPGVLPHTDPLWLSVANHSHTHLRCRLHRLGVCAGTSRQQEGPHSPATWQPEHRPSRTVSGLATHAWSNICAGALDVDSHIQDFSYAIRDRTQYRT
eukprot:3645655-Prymnesium_polylepis.2